MTILVKFDLCPDPQHWSAEIMPKFLPKSCLILNNLFSRKTSSLDRMSAEIMHDLGQLIFRQNFRRNHAWSWPTHVHSRPHLWTECLRLILANSCSRKTSFLDRMSAEPDLDQLMFMQDLIFWQNFRSNHSWSWPTHVHARPHLWIECPRKSCLNHAWSWPSRKASSLDRMYAEIMPGLNQLMFTQGLIFGQNVRGTWSWSTHVHSRPILWTECPRKSCMILANSCLRNTSSLDRMSAEIMPTSCLHHTYILPDLDLLIFTQDLLFGQNVRGNHAWSWPTHVYARPHLWTECPPCSKLNRAIAPELDKSKLQYECDK
jgi:hypothetical protein